MKNNPHDIFHSWYKRRSKRIKYYNSAVLSTVDHNNYPHSRVILLKSYSEEGFIFYSNYLSAKGKQLDNNPNGSLLFYWPEMGKQVRIEGVITKISREQSDVYFQTRPYLSKIGAHASSQSHVLRHNVDLMVKMLKMMHKYPGKVPIPEYWGGYCLKPTRFEFWREGDYRLHTRHIYDLWESGWKSHQLYP